MIPRNYENEVLTDKDLKEFKESCQKSSKVNGWYEHPLEDGNIRGPWGRWINITEGMESGIKQGYIAPQVDDLHFIATAMNNLERLVDEVNRLKVLLNDNKKDL